MDITETTPLMYLTVGQFTDLLKNCAQTPSPLPEQENENELLNIKGVCELTGYSKDTIYKLVRELQIPHYRYTESGRLWFKRSAIQAWLEQQKGKNHQRNIMQ